MSPTRYTARRRLYGIANPIKKPYLLSSNNDRRKEKREEGDRSGPFLPRHFISVLLWFLVESHQAPPQ
ncbi:hypothetical protein OPV22_033748 [Ensete ventricosum]|uniref:Uncharacterized protein n=1 Tax=Ensete ventricosum TaxID=4639 RepID=A0AAV8PZ53_ENSVE|nr:hypothetical protein OPV22_033748 [Ensete ventricosum]